MESVISEDGTRIAFQRCGEGPPLVLVHGTLDDHTNWMPLMPALSEHFTVTAIDRRGRGGSSPIDGATYAIEREFEDVAAVVDSIGEPVNLLGHSFGALCALEAALRTGGLRKLILYEPPMLIPPGSALNLPGAMAAQAKIDALLEAGDRDGAALTFAREIAGLPEEEISAFRSSPGWQTVIATAHTIPYEVRAVRDYVFDPARFHGLLTPTLLLHGSESPPFLKAATEPVAAALPHRKLAVLPGQGHVAMHTAPDLFMHEVVQFLTEE